jgi:catalase (peroxidase I)
VKGAIIKLLNADAELGPLLLRLVFNDIATFDVCKKEDRPGSRAEIRYEFDHPKNLGLKRAFEALEPIREAFPPKISRADMWTFAAGVAVENMGGPRIIWRSGRKDAESNDHTSDNIPNPSDAPVCVRAKFARMGLNDQEMVCLMGAHTVGRCHPNVSGFVGSWTREVRKFDNVYFKDMVGRTWVKGLGSDGHSVQYVDKESSQLIRLESDMALISDPFMRQHVEMYANDSNRFFEDFRAVFKKFVELGWENELRDVKL